MQHYNNVYIFKLEFKMLKKIKNDQDYLNFSSIHLFEFLKLTYQNFIKKKFS